MQQAPRARFSEILMFQQFDAAQKLGKDSFDATLQAFGAAASGTQAIASETAEYAKKSFEQGTAVFEKLAGVKSLDKALEIQTDYLKGVYENFVAQSAKTRELYTKLAQDSLAPFNAVRAAAEAAFVPAKSAARAK